MSNISLILSLFSSSSIFSIITVNSSGLIFIERCDICQGFFTVMFLGYHSSFNGIFLRIRIPYLLMLLNILTSGVLCVALQDGFF